MSKEEKVMPLEISTGGRTPAPIQVMYDINLLWFVATLHAVAEYNFASLLGDGEMTTHQLAECSGTLENWVFRTLRFLSTHDYFQQVDAASRTFRNTERSHCLRDDHPKSMRAMARGILDRRSLHQWSYLPETMRTGRPAAELALGMSTYQYFDLHPGARALFDQMLKNFETTIDTAIVQSFDFGAYERVVDVGGGKGSLLAQIVERYQVRGTLFELERVIAQLEGKLLPFDLVIGDFFHQIPTGDLFILKQVLHNWHDEQCIAILGSCRRANPSAAVLVSEQVIGCGHNFAEALDILMGIEQNGCERTQQEYETLFTQAGYRLSQVIPTPSAVTLLLAEAGA
jgi:hypothetical protein